LSLPNLAIAGYGVFVGAAVFSQIVQPIDGGWGGWSSLGAVGICLGLLWYLITKAGPRQEKRIQEVVSSCQAAIDRCETSKETIVKELTSSFANEIRLERAERKEELLEERKRTHETMNVLNVHALKATESQLAVIQAVERLNATLERQITEK